MRFLDHPPRFLFFTGKGGVGKTSIACAAAVGLADAGRRVLLVSTDPASNVGQVFGIEIGNRITPIPGGSGTRRTGNRPAGGRPGLSRSHRRPRARRAAGGASRASRSNCPGACTTEIAAFDEFTGLLTDLDADGGYDHVIFDTAPTGHTIRLLQLPGAWSGFLEAGKGDASCLGPLAGLDKQRARYAAAVAALADPAADAPGAGARAQPAALREVARTHDELRPIGLRRSGIS